MLKIPIKIFFKKCWKFRDDLVIIKLLFIYPLMTLAVLVKFALIKDCVLLMKKQHRSIFAIHGRLIYIEVEAWLKLLLRYRNKLLFPMWNKSHTHVHINWLQFRGLAIIKWIFLKKTYALLSTCQISNLWQIPSI